MDVDIDALLDSALENNGQVTFPQPKQERAEQRDDRDRDRHRDRDRDRERHKKRSRSEDRDDDRSSRRHKHSRSRSRERRRSRSRSRDRGRRHSDQRDKERARDRERREREEMRRIQREQEALLPAADREAIEFERDQRTVFAFNLPIKADEDDIADFFSKAGKVRDIRLITDRNSRKSKGFAYVEFSDKNTVPEALTFHNKPMMGQIIQVQQTQAEKNRQAGSTMTTTTTFGPTRVYISGLTINVSDDDLRKLFTKFGAVEFVNLLHDPDTGKSKGFAFIQFKRSEDAKRSVMELNGMELYGRIITVGFVSEKDAMNTRKGAMNEFDDEDRGLKMNNAFRVMLSEKLLKTDNPVIGQKPLQLSKLALEPVTKPTAAFPSSSPPSSPTPMPKAPPSPCVKLTNMFDPGTETESNWDQEIKEEVSDECKRFGSIVHIFVDKNSEGHVYLKFGSIPGAQNAINALDKRWFAGRQVTADFVPEKIYYSKFPDAKNK